MNKEAKFFLVGLVALFLVHLLFNFIPDATVTIKIFIIIGAVSILIAVFSPDMPNFFKSNEDSDEKEEND